MSVWTPGPGAPASGWTEQEPAPEMGAGGVRELYADFNTATHLKSGTSIEHRPDAISLDHLTAHTVGPEVVGSADTAYTRAWQVRATATQVFIARASTLGGGYDVEVLLFAYSGSPIIEVDIAFEQAGRPVVVCDRATGAGGAKEVWLYWYDPFASDFVFTSFGEGRTPRVLLDDPFDTSNADVLVFYVKDSGNGMKMRQQRDRYATEYATPVLGGATVDGVVLPPVEDIYCEDAVKAQDGRVVVPLSLHVAGRYSFARLVSTLYPHHADDAVNISTNPTVQDGELRVVLFIVGPAGTEGQSFYDDPEGVDSTNPSVVAGQLRNDFIIAGPPGTANQSFYNDAEGVNINANPSVISGSLVVALIVYTAYDNDAVNISTNPTVQAGSLLVVLITYTAYDNDAVNISTNPSVISGSLAA